MSYEETDSHNIALELLTASSEWMLQRHKWLLDNMRSILTGEAAPTIDSLFAFDDILPQSATLPNSLLKSVENIQSALDEAWDKTIKSSHPMSGLTMFEQLNQYQTSAHQFLQLTQEANHQLWHDFMMRDTLTGAWSRSALNPHLKSTIINAQNQKETCAIALLDQNNFKVINDKWGHVVGDKVLAKTAAIIQSNLRSDDYLFRYGGDEWLISMPGTNNREAHAMIERIQHTCEEKEFSSSDGEIFSSSFSFGIAEFKKGESIESWVTKADKDLYAKKSSPDVSEKPKPRKASVN